MHLYSFHSFSSSLPPHFPSLNLQHSPPNILQGLFFSPLNAHISFHLLTVHPPLGHNSQVQAWGPSWVQNSQFPKGMDQPAFHCSENTPSPQSPQQIIELSVFQR